eukprot:598184-Hanusia_phi.AAC.3
MGGGEGRRGEERRGEERRGEERKGEERGGEESETGRSGGNGITHALVEGDTEALQIAMQCAPRNLRAEWLCQELFKHHEDIVGKLGRECIGEAAGEEGTPSPSDPSRLLTGHRQIRVNYYIRDLYGDPDLEKDPWNSPLAWLVNLGKPCPALPCPALPLSLIHI